MKAEQRLNANEKGRVRREANRGHGATSRRARTSLSPQELAQYRCNNCGVNVVTAGEFYTVNSEIWEEQLRLGWHDNLCIGCLERRLSRRVSLADMIGFPNYPWTKPASDRLLDRYGFAKDHKGKWLHKSQIRQFCITHGFIGAESPKRTVIALSSRKDLKAAIMTECELAKKEAGVSFSERKIASFAVRCWQDANKPKWRQYLPFALSCKKAEHMAYGVIVDIAEAV
jgi:hypothetical protein